MSNSHDPFDLSDAEAVQREADRKAKLAAKLEKDDLQWLMNTPRGRRIAARLLDDSGVFRSSFDTNATRMAFNEGMRNQGLMLTTKLMAHCPDHYQLLLKEFANG